MIAQTVERFGRLDILVNNVGIGSLDGGPVSLEESVWDQVQEVNVKSSYLACKHALPQMRLQQSGSIINISSIAALCPHGTLAYSTSKAAVNALTKEVAIGNARHGIRCNAVMPGLIDTPMANDVVADLSGVDRETVSRRRDAQVPLRARQGQASDIANAVLFLASSEAEFITGVILPVDGGQSSRIG